MNEGEELVGRHDDDDAEDDQHGERAGNAENFGLRGSGDEHLKAGSEKSAEDVHENDGGKESRHHQRRTDDDGKEKKIASFAVLTGSAVSVGQRMGAQPERGRDQGFHNEDDPAHHGRNPADEGNGGQVVGQRQPVQQKGKKNGEQGKGDILVQIRNGLAYEGQLLAHGVRHIHDAERRGQPPCRTDEVVPHIGNRHDGVLAGELFNGNGQNVCGDQLIQRGPQPVGQLVKGPAFIRHGRRGRDVRDSPSAGIGGLDIVCHTFLRGFIVLQAVRPGIQFGDGILVRAVGDAGVHGLADFLIDPCYGPVGRTGDEPAVLGGVFLEVCELALKLSLSGIALQFGKNGRIDLICGTVQRAGVNGGRRRFRVGKLLRHRRKSGDGRSHGIDLAPAQSIAFIHTGHLNGTRVAVEKELVFSPGAEPVAFVVPFSARRDVHAATLVQVILERQRFQSAVGNGRIVRDVLVRCLYGDLTGVFHKVVGPQFPDEIAEVDGKADAGQNGHLEETQPLEDRSQSAHGPHKTQGHPQGAETLAEGYAFMRRSGHGQSHDPQEQRGNDGQRHQIEGAENLEHQFRSLRASKTGSPGIPPLSEEGVENLLAGIRGQKNFRGGREFRGHGVSPFLH